MKNIFLFLLLTISASSWAGPISIENAYIRLLPPTQSITGAFMVLKNTSQSDVALVHVQTDISRLAELHTHLQENGMMRMRQLEKINIPANASTELQPGGYHIMLIDLKSPLTLGQKVSLSLEFDDGSREQIQAEVKNIMAGMSNMNMEHNDMNHKKMMEGSH